MSTNPATAGRFNHFSAVGVGRFRIEDRFARFGRQAPRPDRFIFPSKLLQFSRIIATLCHQDFGELRLDVGTKFL